jgi:RES domain-containing protein
LPKKFLVTPISIPESVLIAEVPQVALTAGWCDPEPIPATQEFGRRWVESNESPVLRVPSTVINGETNYVINVLHPDFPELRFGPSDLFQFDPRLK